MGKQGCVQKCHALARSHLKNLGRKRVELIMGKNSSSLSHVHDDGLMEHISRINLNPSKDISFDRS